MFGGAFTVASALAAGCLAAPRTALPLAIRFTTGAALLSVCLFFILTFNAGYTAVYLVLGFALIAAALWRRPVAGVALPVLHPLLLWSFRTVLAIAAAFYFVYALAPEIQADGVGYHLGLVARYARTHSLSRHVSFYEILPQGVDLLFAPAFAIGAHSAAKLVHFAFLLVTVPLIRHMGSEAGVSPAASLAGAALLFLSPVAIVTGTAAYTDLALVACCCSVFYLLMRWRREPSPILLLLAGINAGFCYAVKPTFGHVALAALAYVFFTSSSRAGASLAFLCGACVTTLPWLLRSFILSGNPIAPLLNSLFPHDGLDASVDSELFHFFSPFNPAFRWRSMLPDYTILGGNQGTLGPAFLLLPLALLALRTKPGRRLLSYSLLLALPFFTNSGTRFLMPAAAPAALAMAAVLPVPVAAGLVAIQALGALTPVTELLNTNPETILPEFPLEAALRIEPEHDYLHRMVRSTWNDDLLHNSTPPNARIFGMAPIAEGYLDRDVLVFWHSSQAKSIRSAMDMALLSPLPSALATWKWQPGAYRELRLISHRPTTATELQITPDETSLHWGGVIGSDDPRVIPLPDGASGVSILSVGQGPPVSVEGLTSGGIWRPLVAQDAGIITSRDLRRDATSFMLNQGYPYVIIPTTNDAFAPIGKDMMGDPARWGATFLNSYRDMSLFRIEPNQ